MIVLNLCFFLQNGYPSRRRSLVDDARFETLVVKQTKQSVLEEARARANGRYRAEANWYRISLTASRYTGGAPLLYNKTIKQAEITHIKPPSNWS